MEKETYEILFAEFMKDYASGTISGENVGELIAKLAGYYPNYNADLVKAERSYALITRDEIMKTDPLTGKAISATKADTLASASSEAAIYKKAKSHMQNLDMLIQSAKYLQKGLLQEMINSNL